MAEAEEAVEPAIVGEAANDKSGKWGGAEVTPIAPVDADKDDDEACSAAIDDAAAKIEGTRRREGVASCLVAPESAVGLSWRRGGIRGSGGGDGTIDDGSGIEDVKNGDSVENEGRNEAEDMLSVALKLEPRDGACE